MIDLITLPLELLYEVLSDLTSELCSLGGRWKPNLDAALIGHIAGQSYAVELVIARRLGSDSSVHSISTIEQLLDELSADATRCSYDEPCLHFV